jgi:hypothetical protein
MMSKRLDDLANVAVIITCAVISAGILTLLVERIPERRRPRFAQGGEIRAKLTHVNFARADKTLLLVVHSECKFCAASFPFYRTLLERRQTTNSSVRFVGVSTEPTEDLKAYFTKSAALPDEFVSIDKGTPVATPTLVLVDRSGTVMREWTGLLDAKAQAELTGMLFGIQ